MIFHIHRIDNNPGDLWSSPRHYFNFKNCVTIDILNKKKLNLIPPGSKCIVGGGGLIKKTFRASLEILFAKKCHIIFWGIGERLNQNLEDGWISRKEKTKVEPIFFNTTLHLPSMRSLEPGIEWLPCASCNHPIFNNKLKTKPKGVKILQHKKVPIPNPNNYPLVSNDPLTIEEFVDFISSASILITNSYHAMYWAYLLSVPTICIPFSSGHYSFCDKMTYCKPYSVKKKIDLIHDTHSLGSSDRADLSSERIKAHRLKSGIFYSKAMHFLEE